MTKTAELHFSQVRVKDLLNQSGPGPHSFLFCPICGAHYSANKGDYFMRSPEHVFKCCRESMWLATESRTITRLGVDHAR